MLMLCSLCIPIQGLCRRTRRIRQSVGEDSRYMLYASQPDLAAVSFPHSHTPSFRRVTEGRLDSDSQGLMGRGYLAFP